MMAVETEYTQAKVMFTNAELSWTSRLGSEVDEDGVRHKIQRLTVEEEQPWRAEDEPHGQLTLYFDGATGALLHFRYRDDGAGGDDVDGSHFVDDEPEVLEELDAAYHSLRLVDKACRALLVEVDALCAGLPRRGLPEGVGAIRRRLRTRQRQLLKLLDYHAREEEEVRDGE